MNRCPFLFVIPSEAEGSAVSRTHRGRRNLSLDMNCPLDGTYSLGFARDDEGCRIPRMDSLPGSQVSKARPGAPIDCFPTLRLVVNGSSMSGPLDYSDSPSASLPGFPVRFGGVGQFRASFRRRHFTMALTQTFLALLWRDLDKQLLRGQQLITFPREKLSRCFSGR
jgi:hypothetical protein